MLRGLLAAAAAASLLVAPSAIAGAKAGYQVDFEALAASSGTAEGAVVSGGTLSLPASGLPSTHYTDPHGHGTRSYDYGTWTSAWVTPGFDFAQLVPSWNADTPAGTWLQVDVKARALDGHETKWYILGRWAYGDADIHRTSVSLQGDDDAFVSIDTLVARDALRAYQVRVTLYRATGTSATPTLTRIAAVASNSVKKYGATSTTTMTETKVLGVPQYSQEIHVGHYPQFDNGGQAWCSPTSTSMVLDYWRSGPTAADYGWVLADDPNHVDPWVDHAARYVYDYNYQGAGNWPFNVAYASQFGLAGEVTQLRSLAEAEQFIKAGIPLVASIAFSKLDGAPIKSTNGHLMVIKGFMSDGRVVANDPAAPDNATVHRVYDRGQFESQWLAASGGIVYVMYPRGYARPTVER